VSRFPPSFASHLNPSAPTRHRRKLPSRKRARQSSTEAAEATESSDGVILRPKWRSECLHIAFFYCEVLIPPYPRCLTPDSRTHFKQNSSSDDNFGLSKRPRREDTESELVQGVTLSLLGLVQRDSTVDAIIERANRYRLIQVSFYGPFVRLTA
jgi:hypothetical protein